MSSEDYAGMSDEELVSLHCRSHDEHAFAVLHERYRDGFLRSIARRYWNWFRQYRHMFEACFDDTFTHAARTYDPNHERRAKFATFLRCALTNRVIDLMRRLARRGREVPETDLVEPHSGNGNGLELLIECKRSAKCTESQRDQVPEELSDLLAEAIRREPEACQKLLYLRLDPAVPEGYAAQAEILAQMGHKKTQEAWRVTFWRNKSRILGFLEDHGYGSGRRRE